MVQVVGGRPRRVHAGSNVCLTVCCLFLATRLCAAAPACRAACTWQCNMLPSLSRSGNSHSRNKGAGGCSLACNCMCSPPWTHIFDAALLGAV